MILTSVVIVGGTVITGTLGAGVKVYRDKKREKEYPWTVAAERIGVYPLVTQKRENRFITIGKTAFNKLMEQQKSLLPSDMRQQQLAELSAGREEAEITGEEEELNRLMAVSLGSFALATGGLWLPALNMLSLPALMYIIWPLVKRAKTLILTEKRFGLSLVDLMWSLGMLATGHYIALSLFLGFLYFTEKLVIKSQDRSMSHLVNIFSEQPRFVWILVNGVEVEVPFEKVQAGDTVVIQAGQIIAVDGMIAKGYATIDQRTLTGESQPVEKGPGEQVLASTVVLSGKIYVQVDCEAPCGKSWGFNGSGSNW